MKNIGQKPCEDAISRQAVMEICNEEWDSDLIVERIGQLPSVAPQQKTGHWLKVSNGTLCSICRGYAIDDDGLTIFTDYCPWCGAKMQEDKE